MDLVCLISDLHVGRQTPIYNIEVFRQRFARILNFLRSHAHHHIHLFFLGDMVDGENIYPRQPYDQDVDINTALNEVLTACIKACEYAARCWCVVGNHGRSSRRGKGNWDWVLYRMLKEAVEPMGVEVNVSDGWYQVAEVKGWRFLLTHGDNVRMYQQIPYYGIHRAVTRWKSGGIREDFDVVCMGHFHTVADFWVNDVRVLLNGTMLSGDDYSERMGLKPVNAFWVFAVGKKSPIVWSRLVWVDGQMEKCTFKWTNRQCKCHLHST